MTSILRVAAVQMRPKLGHTERNLETIRAGAREAKERGARMVVFPECALQGIVFDSEVEARQHAVDADGPEIAALATIAEDFDLAVVCGFLERLPEGYANSACVALPGGATTFYRKTHVTELGADRWARPGEALSAVVEFEGVRFGVMICYDIRFPEVSRTLTLRGCDVLLLPTNSPEKYEAAYDHGIRTRAWENRIWLVAANRVGTERDATFIGRSLVADPMGKVAASVDGDTEAMIVVDIDVEAARSKLLPGHEGRQYDFFAARRPELYTELTAPAPGRQSPLAVPVP